MSEIKIRSAVAERLIGYAVMLSISYVKTLILNAALEAALFQ